MWLLEWPQFHVALILVTVGLVLRAFARRRSSSRLGNGSAVADLVAVGAAAVELGAPLPRSITATIVDESYIPTEAEQNLVGELRQRVRPDRVADALPGGERWYEDGELLRFVRARTPLIEAEKLFREALAWRCEQAREWGMSLSAGSWGAVHSQYLGQVSAAGSKSSKPPSWWAFLNEYLPQETYGEDKHGLPIAYSAVGRTDLQGCVREVGFEALLRYGTMANDYFLDAARAATNELAAVEGSGMVLHGGVYVVDLDGLGWRHLNEARIFNRLGAVAKVLHPERNRRCFIVRAPKMFSVVWRLVKPLVDPRTAARICILSSSDSLEPLFRELGPENVPHFLGGTRRLRCRPSPDLVPVRAYAHYQEQDRMGAAV